MAPRVVVGGISGVVSSGTLKGAALGALQGGLFAEAGNFLKAHPTGFFGIGHAPSAFLAHGLVGGLVSEAGGGRFGSGFLAGAISSFAPAPTPGQPLQQTFEGTVISAALGGAGSVLGGGKFENGAVTGAFGYLFNELQHVKGLPVERGSHALPYFDDSISTKISTFFDDLLKQGIPVELTSGFRTIYTQSEYTGNQYGGAQAGSSLHEAGFAWDINWNALSVSQRDIVLNEADRLGIDWGGYFRKVDIVHFYIDPFANLSARRAYIPIAQQQYRSLTAPGGN